MEKYEKPIMEVIEIDSDVITGSCATQGPIICAIEA